MAALLAPYGRLLAAPGFERTDQYRRRQGRADKQDLLVQRPIDRNQYAEQRRHEGNWQDWGHNVTHYRQDRRVSPHFPNQDRGALFRYARRKVRGKFTLFSSAGAARFSSAGAARFSSAGAARGRGKGSIANQSPSVKTASAQAFSHARDRGWRGLAEGACWQAPRLCFTPEFSAYHERAKGVSVVRLVAELALVVAAHPNFAGAPRLERAHQNRRGKRRPCKQELLKQHAPDRPEGAEQCDQKRNWQDGGHLGGPFGDKPMRVASAERNADRLFRFPAPPVPQ
jgi:hypothetical protein